MCKQVLQQPAEQACLQVAAAAKSAGQVSTQLTNNLRGWWGGKQGSPTSEGSEEALHSSQQQAAPVHLSGFSSASKDSARQAHALQHTGALWSCSVWRAEGMSSCHGPAELHLPLVGACPAGASAISPRHVPSCHLTTAALLCSKPSPARAQPSPAQPADSGDLFTLGASVPATRCNSCCLAPVPCGASTPSRQAAEAPCAVQGGLTATTRRVQSKCQHCDSVIYRAVILVYHHQCVL